MKPASRLVVSVTKTEYLQHCASYDGLCLGCGEWSWGDCEPDARRYRCDACGELRVYGAEEAQLMGRISIEEEEEE